MPLLRSCLIAAIAACVLGAAFSCKTFDLPAETCNPATLDAKQYTSEGDTNCTRCLEDHCCDVVGVCERKEGCAEHVSGLHSCVLSAGLQGAREETKCAAERLAGDPEAADAYRCMRDRCGVQCGLPVCRVTEAAALIQSAKCDQCFAGACCGQLNACYGSRACKLMVECISVECGKELGPSMTELAGLAPGVHVAPPSRKLAEVLCSEDGAGTARNFRPPACVRTCLCRYKDNDQGLPPANPELLPLTMALRIFDCGVTANCGPECSVPVDASTP